MRSSTLTILVLAALLAVASPAGSAPGSSAGVASGVYDDYGVLIGFNPATRRVSGYLSIEEDLPPTFSCIFYLEGRLDGSRARVVTYYPPDGRAHDAIDGQLTLNSAHRFALRLRREPDGCDRFADFDGKSPGGLSPVTFQLVAAHPWISIAVVRSPKAYFYDSPDSRVHRPGYVVKGDGVGVRATRPGWLAVDHVDAAKPESSRVISGWIRQSDVFPAD